MKHHILPMFPTGWVKYDDLNKEIEKRKPKKPKENKKPIISAVTTTTSSTTIITAVTSTDPKSNNNNKIKENNSISSKTVLSTINSVLKTKDVTVKKNSTPPLPISTSSSTISNNISNSKQSSESSTKKTNSVPTGYSSSLTITPVTSTATNFTKTYSNVQNKVTITNIDNSTASIPSQLTNLIKNSEKLKTPPITSSASTVVKSSSATKLPSSLSISITPTNNSPNSSSINSTTTTTTSTTTTTTKLDNSQISRRTSDYSINSIMSAAAAPPIGNNSQKLTEKTQLINLDSLKSKDELVKHLNSTKENLLKVRSVDHMNNQMKSGFSDNNNSKDNNKMITTISSEDEELVFESDSSDGVEIVGVFPVSSKKPKPKNNKHNIVVNKTKYAPVDPLQIDGQNKSSSSRSKGCDEIKISKPFSIPVIDTVDVDVNKIMKELKELVGIFYLFIYFLFEQTDYKNLGF